MATCPLCGTNTLMVTDQAPVGVTVHDGTHAMACVLYCDVGPATTGVPMMVEWEGQPPRTTAIRIGYPPAWPGPQTVFAVCSVCMTAAVQKALANILRTAITNPTAALVEGESDG